MAYARVPFLQAALTADGNATGLLTIASTATLVKGALIWLNSGTQVGKQLQIASIASATTFYVRDPASKSYYTFFNCSAYLVADTATITQNSQDDFGAPATADQN